MKRALISVSDKAGVVEFAKELLDLGWGIISTGGTYGILKQEGLNVTEVSDITGFPEAFDGRVKTLHPNIHGGILHRRSLQEHTEKADELGIDGIDMVVVNLYPFKAAYENPNSTHEDIIENIDIGGPSLIRAASKNYQDVNIVVDPADYSKILGELRLNGTTQEDTRLNLAKKAFGHTAAYDAMIAKYFNEITADEFPEKLILAYDKESPLRYGENPHQSAALYVESLGVPCGVGALIQHNGKELSYNNINDVNEGVDIIREFDEPTAIAIKHGNPCGAASAESLLEAFNKAHEADPQSIYGGIVILNRRVEGELAEILKGIFLEIVIAPSYSKEALEILSEKKNLRVLEQADILKPHESSKLIKAMDGGLLVQDKDNILLGEELKTVTKLEPDANLLEDLLFAWKIVKGTKSNAVVIAKDKRTVAVGPGQVSRIWALENAIKQGENRVNGAVLASDAFFPFGDCVELAAKSGIKAIIQPGGAKKDQESIDLADQQEIAMVFTGVRHFKH